MDTRKLEVLLKVIKTQNLTAAGDEMGFTQSGVSHLVKSIENELGFQILIRGKTGVRLTENGREVIASIRDVVNANERLTQLASNIRGMSRGRIRIGTFTSISVFWLPKIIEQFSCDYPGVQIELMEGGDERIQAFLDEDLIDFAFMSRKDRPYEWIPLAKDRILALVPKRHPLALKKTIKLSELEPEPFIMSAEGFDYEIERILRDGGMKPRVAFSSMDDHAIISMVQHGLGVSIVPEMMLFGISTDAVMKELNPGEFRELGISVRSLKNASLAARTFIEYSQRIASGQSLRVI